ncbi:uncharacterized protein K489DRAFT_77913 [Dissoconium aciculare CBS 342.82]|jgi:hypothetical protein|uniref:Potassium channel tetramerisation-type BTB domain-containing protein n=1 Tax=Dissoconium aciculare CBS 342.82 TaxID=1314786 RepID=A0A6J3LUC2_9PEZI|nr:uncharacterized protein K489DRAFT_77913 [Dissoconium aciculare CBS 342.82]KAF1819243.1 hypothetical protein K489DRAFT_77913 [Dissoconium aciculare CBS 342.82]
MINPRVTTTLPETFVKIKTGNQTFVTKPSSWKGKSLYFDQLFSGRWNDKSPDGSYYIDTDAQVFKHILLYLRTGVLPIFYDKTTGHDEIPYHQVLNEAEYFCIDRLVRWINGKTYLKVVDAEVITCDLWCPSLPYDNGPKQDSKNRILYQWKYPGTVNMPLASNMEGAVVAFTETKGKETGIAWRISRKEWDFNSDICTNPFREQM